MRRKLGLFLVVIGVLPLVGASSASAQGALLKANPSTASPGQTVTMTGRGFTTGTGATNRALRLGTRTGQVLIPSVSLDGTSSRLASNTDFIVPNLTPGTYLLLLTEDRTTALPAPAPPMTLNQPAGFGPGRTTLRVVSAGVRSGAAGADRAGDGGSSVPPLVPLAVSLALLLLAAGVTVTARRSGVFQRISLGR